MRFSRSSLLAAVGDLDNRVLVVESPSGSGKSWLLRQTVPPGAVRVAEGGLLAALGGLDGGNSTWCLVVDDAERLDEGEVAALVAAIESASGDQRLIVAGRLLDDAVLEAADLVDGLVVGAERMMISAGEVVEAAGLALPTAELLVDVAGGNVRVLARALESWSGDPRLDPVEAAAAAARMTATATMSRLDAHDAAIVRLIARIVDVDRAMLDGVADAGFLARAVCAGVPLHHEHSGGLSISAPATFASGALDGPAAGRMATALLGRERRLEAVHLLLDVGDHPRAAREVIELPSSTIETMEPRATIALVNRFGAYADEHPALLLLRAGANARLGQRDRAWADVQRAEALASVDAPVKRQIDIEVAELRLSQGHRAEAVTIAERVLAEVQPGEEQAYARACTVLAEAAATHRDREHLQVAAEWFTTAATTWSGCGEPARARSCRCDLVSAALVPLGRFDQALAELQQMLAIPELSDNERSWLVLIEGFSLFDAGRESTAGERFTRAADLGQILDNPRIVATAAWGRALVAARHYDRAATLQWMYVASNTGLGPADDVLGVSYLCDMAIALGALGEIDLADEHLARAHERPPLFPDHLEQAEFITRGRIGTAQGVEAVLATTPPAHRWRTQLIGALGAARSGDLATAAALRADAERELVSLGLGTFEALGERAADTALTKILHTEPVVVERAATNGHLVAVGRRLLVIGGPMSVADRDGIHHIPAGNAQRLVGVVAARGGVASIDTLAEAMWPNDDLAVSRARLRNVLMRLRRGAGSVLARTGTSIRLAPDVTCDLHEFVRRASDAQSAARSDPDVGGHLAAEAVKLVDGEVFADFEYEEWAQAARHQVDQMTLGLLDLLSVQAEDAHDLATAQHLAERALRLDRYTDSRYIRLAELLTLQGRNAAAATVLEDAAIAAREHSPIVSEIVGTRRRELLRKASGR